MNPVQHGLMPSRDETMQGGSISYLDSLLAFLAKTNKPCYT